MSPLSDLRVKAAKAWPFQTLPPMDWSAQAPTFADANPAVIRSALRRAGRRPSGNWYAFAASSQIVTKACGGTVAGVQIVAWRGADGGLLVAPRGVSALGRGPVHRTGRVRNADMPVARSAAVGPTPWGVETVPGV